MKFERVLKYFPLPQFVSPGHIGMSFSSSSVKAMFLDGSNTNPEIKSIIIPLEKGVISDGKIENLKELATKISEIKKFFSSESFVSFAIPDELIYLFRTSAPLAKGSSVTEALAFSIEENVPLPLSETIFDFEPLGVRQLGSEYGADVVVAASVKKEVEKFSEAIKLGGLNPAGAVHESQAIANALMPKNFSGSACIVHARKDRIGIYLVRNSAVIFSTLRYVYEGTYEHNFLDEYDKFLEYSSRYEKEEKSPIKIVFVCGEFEFAQKTVESVSKKDLSKREVKLANVWSNVLEINEKTPSLSYEESINFAGPVGAALSNTL
ncbi:MAG TPA: pilus assembly protein PilM [Candidatus Paceibacterota bacterium]